MSTPSHANRRHQQMVLKLMPACKREVGKVLDSPAHGVDIAFSYGFEFAGCVNITHRAPNQFAYRYGRKVAPADWTIP